MIYHHRENVDEIVSHFWRNGYLTISRRFGKYLPEPDKIGRYEVDAVARYKKKIAIGLIITKEDLNDKKLPEKLKFLTMRNSRYSANEIKLFVGVSSTELFEAKTVLMQLDPIIRKQIKLVQLPGRN
ncbi:MAG: hypothetical protein K9I69_08310 [Ignavibacteriales bacterium]|nr:hypothetical protein [Ignavibacteriales bacterium]MCF8305233.1 hypothetical protein [Ignavibacteriales bacterium]MCF8314854.1 hypothetical protein [Ignavibacteriales bacterium]MCF8436197.1 hypothetical protein [Ignavibacteriales bacterium]